STHWPRRHARFLSDGHALGVILRARSNRDEVALGGLELHRAVRLSIGIARPVDLEHAVTIDAQHGNGTRLRSRDRRLRVATWLVEIELDPSLEIPRNVLRIRPGEQPIHFRDELLDSDVVRTVIDLHLK